MKASHFVGEGEDATESKEAKQKDLNGRQRDELE